MYIHSMGPWVFWLSKIPGLIHIIIYQLVLVGNTKASIKIIAVNFNELQGTKHSIRLVQVSRVQLVNYNISLFSSIAHQTSLITCHQVMSRLCTYQHKNH